MLQPFGQYAQRQCLRPSHSLLTSLAICENSREIDNFGDPPAIDFAFNLDRIHGRYPNTDGV